MPYNIDFFYLAVSTLSSFSNNIVLNETCQIECDKSKDKNTKNDVLLPCACEI